MLTDDEWRFVYSPRLGAVYKLDSRQVANDTLLKLLGLRPSMRVGHVDDPAVRVGLGGAHEKEISPVELSRWAESEPGPLLRRLCRWYRLFHRHRHVFTPMHVYRWSRLLARSGRRQDLTADRIARLVALTERQAGLADCYPRSLLAGGLCAMAGIESNITIGMLAPTRKLHAWCTSGGTLLYEPTPRHWWYRPLIDFQSGTADEP